MLNSFYISIATRLVIRKMKSKKEKKIKYIIKKLESKKKNKSNYII